MPKRNIIITADGSTSIQLEAWNEQYHSKHGAIQEAKHVFIQNGFRAITKANVSILEMGFGTGLNALVTLIASEKQDIQVDYVGIEAYPVGLNEYQRMNFAQEIGRPELKAVYEKMHSVPWGDALAITSNFTLTKIKKDFFDVNAQNTFDLVYFDAFGPRVQPELWTTELFLKMFEALLPNGILVTYSAKGSVRRSLQEVGFSVERLPGPPGKREMLRGMKPR